MHGPISDRQRDRQSGIWGQRVVYNVVWAVTPDCGREGEREGGGDEDGARPRLLDTGHLQTSDITT